MPTSLRGAAEEAASALQSVASVEAVCLFGSVARDDHDPTSDVDLLVLGTGRLTPGGLRRHLSPDLRERVSLSYHTPSSLTTYLDQWSRFSVHLRNEGKILFDRHGRLRSILDQPRPLSTQFELEVQLAHLHTFEQVERFGGRFLFPLAHLYRIGRTVVYALLAELGSLEFNQERAFVELARRLPDASADVNSIAALRPFSQLVRGRAAPECLPFSYEGCGSEVAKVIGAIRRLTRFSRHAGELAG